MKSSTKNGKTKSFRAAFGTTFYTSFILDSLSLVSCITLCSNTTLQHTMHVSRNIIVQTKAQHLTSGSEGLQWKISQ